jgi:large subunit ribosomal protein L17
VPKAKELRPFVERIITIAKRGLAAGDANAGTLHARRMVLRDIQNRDVVAKLFDTIAPRFEARPGGYTRILRLGFRRGDSAESRADRAGRQRVQPEREAEKAEKRQGRRPRASADGCARQPTPARQGQAEGEEGPRARRIGSREEGQAGRADAARAARPTPAARAPNDDPAKGGRSYRRLQTAINETLQTADC